MTKAKFQLLTYTSLAPIALAMARPVFAQTVQPAIGAPAQAAAADAATSPQTDIIVTANKRAESALSVPTSITAISGAALTDKGIYSVQDLVKVTPGLSYIESGRSIPVFSLRGVGFFDQSLASRPTVSVYVDEAPLPFSIEARGGAFDLERVEVLKGPQGTLFGQNATGGAINYIAAKPTDVFHAGMTASYGRFNTGDVQAYVSGPLSSTLSARIAVRTVQSGDWQRSYTRRDTLGSQNFTQGRFLLTWKPNDRLSVNLNLNGFHDGSDTQAPQYVAFAPGTPARANLIPALATYPLAPADARAADWDPGKDYRNHNWFGQGNLRIDYEATDTLKLTSITSYSHMYVRQLADADGTALTNIDSRMQGTLKSLSQELRAAGDVGPISYIVGLNYAADDTRVVAGIDIPYSTSAYALGTSPATLINANNASLNQHFNTHAVFGNLDYHLTDRLTIRGGIRYTAADLHYDACSTAATVTSAAASTLIVNSARRGLGLAPIPALQIGQCTSLNPDTLDTSRYFSKLNQENVSWRTGVDFKPTSSSLLYVSVSTGFKAGSGSTPAASNDLQFAPALQESVLAYEVGAEAALFHRKVEITAAAFYYNYHDKQLLGSGLVDQSQKMTVAASAIAEKKTVGHRS